jgi:hypothetical protein
MNPRFHGMTLGIFVLGACALFLARPVLAEDAPIGAPETPRAEPSDGVVRLPPFFVTGANPVHWRYVAIPGFEILSSCPDDLTAPFARRVYLNQALLDAIVPADLQARETVPTTMILLNAGLAKGMAAKITALAKEPVTRTRVVLAQFGTPSLPETFGKPAQIKLQDADSTGADFVVDENSRDFEFDPAHVFFVLAERKPPPPLWFVEGILNFRYHHPSGDFELQRLRDEADVAVKIHPAFWISPEIEDYARTCFEDSVSGGNVEMWLSMLLQRLSPFRKVLMTPPPAPATGQPAESAIARRMLPFRELFTGPAPPFATDQAKEAWLNGLIVSLGEAPAGVYADMNRNKLKLGQTQVQILFDDGANKDSPWRLDLWGLQAPLFERSIFDGMSIAKVLTEAPPPPAGEPDKELWFARAGLGIPPGKSADETLALHRIQFILAHGTDAGSPWRLDIWRSQAALFVRWAFDDPTRSRREALWKLGRYACTSPVTEAVTNSFVLFPRGSLEIPYIGTTNYISNILNFGQRPADLELGDPTKAEKARILGDWERKEIDFVRNSRPEYTDLYIGQAESTLMNGYNAGASDPGLLAALGLYECAIHNDAQAGSFLAAATGAEVTRPRAYVELARIRLDAALARPGGMDGRLTRTQAVSVLKLLWAVRSLQPPQLEAYLLAAEVWEHADFIPLPGELGILDEGLYFFPDNPQLILAAAQLDAVAGLRVEAIRVLDRGLQRVSDPAMRRLFAGLRARYTAMSTGG